jgi:uncharacterized protein
MKAAASRITASMFAQYASCPHWIWFDRFEDTDETAARSRFVEMLIERGLVHEERIIQGLEYVRPKGSTMEEQFASTVSLMEQGVDRIYQGVLINGDLIGKPDLLERHDDRRSKFGPYHYVAIDIKSGDRLTDVHRYQLTFYGELLKAIQNIRPSEGYVLNGSGARIGFPLKEFEKKYRHALDAIRRIVDGEMPPPHLSSGCKQSPFFSRCIEIAEESNDVTLLYNVKRKTLDKLRELGIRTVVDAAEMDVASVVDADPDLTKKTIERAKVQAQALIDGKHRVRKAFAFPRASMEIFFDIEGDPLRSVEYLFGFLIRDGEGERYVEFLAETPEDEGKMWGGFVDWIEGLPEEYSVYHYGTYETARLSTLSARHGRGGSALERFRERMIDLNEVVKDSIVFPLYFYSIKDIGKYVGFEREGDITGGGESVAFYEEWLATRDRTVMDHIILYNKEDVIATRALKDWLANEMKNA